MYEIFERLMKEKRLTQYKVAKATGLSQSTLSSWKTGQYVPKADKLQILADYFDVPVEYLMTGVYPGTEQFDMKPVEIEMVNALRAKEDQEERLVEYFKKFMKLSDADSAFIEKIIDNCGGGK